MRSIEIAKMIMEEVLVRRIHATKPSNYDELYRELRSGQILELPQTLFEEYACDHFHFSRASNTDDLIGTWDCYQEEPSCELIEMWHSVYRDPRCWGFAIREQDPSKLWDVIKALY